MFVITAKFNKRKVISALIAAVVIAAVLIICFSGGGSSGGTASPASLTAIVKNNDQRVAYLESFGWQVSAEPVDQQEIIIPKEFSDVYVQYNELQTEQGFNLKDYCGLEAVRYTYQVTNHPTAQGTVVADIIVYRNQVIAGDIQCLSADNGFMAGLQYPNTSGSV